MIEQVAALVSLSVMIAMVACGLWRSERRHRLRKRFGHRVRAAGSAATNGGSAWLVEAGINMSWEEASLIVLTFVSAGLSISALAGMMWVLCVAAAFATGIAPVLWTLRRKERRRRELEQELEGLLLDMSSSLRVNPSLRAALETGYNGARGRMRSELERSLLELDCGLTLEQVLRRLAGRIRSQEMSMAVEAIVICRDTGGRLAQVLERIAQVGRNRSLIEAEVRALTAQPRTTATAVSLIPLIFLALMYFVNASYVRYLWTPLGGIVLVYSTISVSCGFLLLKRMARIVPREVSQ